MPEVIEKRVALRGAAQQLMKCRGSEVLLCGAAGTGKSFACLWKLHLMMLVNPGARALIVRKTHVSLTETGLVTFREQVAADAIASGLLHWYGGSGDKPAGYRYSNGSFVAVGGMDKPMKIMSSEYDLIYVQEATELTLNDVEMMTTRLRNGRISFQQLLMDCNPQAPTHWLKKRCDDGRTTMLYSKHEDNPRIVDDDGTMTTYGTSYLAKLDALSGARRLRLRHGKWAASEGQIYVGWDPAAHLSNRKILSPEWDRYWAVDFGYTNPFVWQQWAVDPDGGVWLEREIYKTQTLVEDHARAILAEVRHKGRNKDHGEWIYPKPRAIICDHDAEDRATLERHLNMGTVPAWKGVSDGIQAVQKRLKLNGKGEPVFHIRNTSLVHPKDPELVDAGKPACTAEEMEGYIWKPKAGGPVEKPEPDEPLKLNDHGMDACRYFIAYLDLTPRGRVRFM